VRAAPLAALAFAAVALAAGREFATVHNRLLMERQDVDSAWQQLEIALQHRADLIPALVESIQQVAPPGDHDKPPVFRTIAAARGALYAAQKPAEKIAANERLSNALARLLVLSENYRQLRTSKPFLRSEEEIAAAENRIAVERRKYNEILEHYNSSIQMFPDNIVAAVSGFSRNDAYFRTELGARTGKE
jgi:LemA protein